MTLILSLSLLLAGMAYASLADLDPIYGIYTAIFPVIVYVLLGPSRHVSMGVILAFN